MASRGDGSRRLLGVLFGVLLAGFMACRAGPDTASEAVPPASTRPVSVPPKADVESAANETDAELLERVVLALLDGEGLYTAASGLKPLSSGYWSTRFEVAAPDLQQIERMRRLLDSVVGVDDLDLGVQVFQEPHEGQRSVQAFVVHRAALRRVLSDERAPFAPLGLGPNSSSDEVLAIVERQPKPVRYRCYGLLFGYPPDAVDFFVEAHEEEARTGERVAREFAHVPTFASERHRFVWAVPVGRGEGEDVVRMRARAAPLLETYRALRKRFIGPGKPGSVDLLRAVARLAPATTESPLSSARKSP